MGAHAQMGRVEHQAGDAMLLKVMTVSACFWGALYFSVAAVAS